MDTAMIDAHLENIDRRLTHLEQILPTLATKDELRLGIEPLATREELEQRLAAHSAELRREIRGEAIESRHYMKILDEAHRGDIQLLAEHLLEAMRKPPKE